MAFVLGAHCDSQLHIPDSPVLALSQLKTCFHLQMAGTIATYEIVLVQFSHMTK
jgi:hypothetical protein